MVAKSHTVTFEGVNANPVTVEVYFLPGLPSFSIVGLANKSVSESKDRIRACFHAIGLSLPPKRITVNLAPADQQKEGSHYDLPIALALFAAMGILDPLELEKYIILGELSLDGNIMPVNGILPAALYASSKNKGIICPRKNANEATWVGDISILAPKNLIEIVNHFKGTTTLEQPSSYTSDFANSCTDDLKDVKGQMIAKRALEIAAAGGHNLLMIGPPGAGKSMLAKRIAGILPPLTPQEALDTTMIYSIAGMLDKAGIITQRPYRSPHHSASLVALVGGGKKAKPGEISLAHNGVLFMDELPEFSRVAIESLRQPMESNEIIVSRAENHITYPAKFQLIAAMNPCRCGYFGHPKKQCHRVPQCARDYQQKISGPILDRFDLIVYMGAVDLKDLHQREEEPSTVLKKRVYAARLKQCERGIMNSDLDGDKLKDISALTESLQNFLINACEKLDVSARRFNRILRVARTIADLENAPTIEKNHILEALSYRMH